MRVASGDSRRRGFTLIEMLIVVAVMGLLAAVAIPVFLRFQLNAKATEGKTNLGAIRTASEAYYSEYGRYASATPVVPATVGSVKQPWPLTGNESHGFNQIGFRPEGRVWYQYGMASNGTNAFTVEARSDIDADGVFNAWGYVKPAPGSSTGIDGPMGMCATSGVYNFQTGVNDLLEVVGPCDSASGSTVY